MSQKYQDYTNLCSEKTLQSNEKGFFMQFVEHVIENAGQNWIKDVFGKLGNDKERIRIIYEYEPVSHVVNYTLSHVQEIYRKKSAEVSQARRLDADKAVKNGEKPKALALYSQSVIRAPPTGENINVDSGITLALALWGRSEVLMALDEYSLALFDVQSALKEGLYNSYKAEAFWRMGVCYKAKGEFDRAKISFGIAEKLMADDNKKLKMLKADMDREYVEAKHVTKRVMPSITGKAHPDYPKASKKITVKETQIFGRFFVAEERISTGETIVVEPPYSACLIPEHFGTHCHHCFERLVSPVGCPDCSNVAFCKAECRDAAMGQYHRYECKYLDLLIGSGMSILSHTALRMITQNSLKRSLEIYENRSLERVYSLCTNATMRSPEDFFQRTLMAAFLLRCLQRSGYFSNSPIGEDCTPTEQEYRIGELLLFHLQVLQFNAHEIYETRCIADHRLRNAKASYIGVAIYPTVALFNHECYPAVARYFVGKNIVITSSRPIERGEIVAENYGSIFLRRNLSDRQKWLAGRYWFECRCNACTQGWPSLENGIESISRRIRCPTSKCTYYFTLPVQMEVVKCPRCKKRVSLTDNIFQLKTCEEQLKVAMDLFEREESEKGIELLKLAIETFHRVSQPPHRDLHLGQELLRTFLADSGNVYECPT